MPEELKGYTGKLLFTEADRFVALRLVPTTHGIDLQVYARSEQRECLEGMVRDGSFPPGVRVYELIGEPDYPRKKRRTVDDLVCDIS